MDKKGGSTIAYPSKSGTWTFFMRSNNNNHLWYCILLSSFIHFHARLSHFAYSIPHLSVLQDFALVGSIAYQPQTGPIKDWGLCKGSLLDRCWQHFGAAAFKFLECQRWNLKITVLCLCDCNGNTIWKHSLPLSSHVLVAYQSRLTIWYNLMQFDTIWLFPNFHRFAKQLQCHGSPLTRSP